MKWGVDMIPVDMQLSDSTYSLHSTDFLKNTWYLLGLISLRPTWGINLNRKSILTANLDFGCHD